MSEGPAASLAGAPPPMPAPPPLDVLSASREFLTVGPQPVAAPAARGRAEVGAQDREAAPPSLAARLGDVAAPRVATPGADAPRAHEDASARVAEPAAAPHDAPHVRGSSPARVVEPVALAAASLDVPAVTQRTAPASSREHPLLGVQLDVGFPDGVGASLMLMPTDWLRLQVGGSWNGVSRGLRGGLVALLFPSFFKSVRPTVSIEGGYAFDTDSRWLDSLVQDDALKAALSKVNVLHGGGHLGLEFGSKYFSFFLRAGVSYVDVQLASYEGESVVARGLALHGLFPSGKLGFLVCFL